VLALAEATRADSAPRLLIDHSDYFHAYLEVTGLSAEQAPAFLRAPYENGEDQVLELRRDRVIRAIRNTTQPKLAVGVCAGWQSVTPRRMSYYDTTASPSFRTYHDRVNSYRVLMLDSVVLYDDVRGVGGRATSGVAGAVFNVIGDGRAVRTRMAFGSDGSTVARTTAHKVFSLTRTATVLPNGTLHMGVPNGRQDLQRLASLLERDFDIEYVPASCGQGG